MILRETVKWVLLDAIYLFAMILVFFNKKAAANKEISTLLDKLEKLKSKAANKNKVDNKY